MTSYISLLTVDELNYVCSLIPAKLLKDYYSQNNVEFHKLLKVRPQKMTEKETRSFAVSNAKAGFIAYFLNGWIGMRLQEIETNLNALLEEGKDETEALVETLTDCVFSDRIEIYYTLIQDMPTPEYLSLIKRSIAIQEQQKSIQDSNIAIEDTIRDYEEKLATQQSCYEKKLEELRQAHAKETQTLQTENAAKLSDIKQARDELMVSLEVTKGELEQAKEALEAVEARLAEYEKHANLEIDDDGFCPSEGFSYVSLCENYTDTYQRSRLRRIADIDSNGRIVHGFLEEYPHYERLYRKDGPSVDGTVAVWDWSVNPSQSDPTRLHFDSAYNHRLSPTVVIIDPDCLDTTDLVAHLLAGIEIPSWAIRVLYVYYNGSAYEGILLYSNILSQSAGKYRLKDSVLKLRVFEVRASDILHFEGIPVSILGHLNLGMPVRIIQVRDSMEIVRDAILARSSWAILKQLDFKHSQYQQVKSFLTELPLSSLYEEIAEKCDCDLEEATVLVHRFIENASAVLDGRTISTVILSQSIRNNTSMYRSCLEDLRTEWEATNKADIDAANTALSQIKAEEQKCQEVISQTKKQHDELEHQIAEFRCQIDAREQLAADVEERVKEKIEQARKQAADFIAENAFTNPAVSLSLSHSVDSPRIPAGAESYVEGTSVVGDNLEAYEDWSRLLKTIQDDLSSAGVTNKALPGLSACLYSAYLHQTPVMLAGPLGMEIAKAFSIALCSRLPDIIHCGEGSVSNSFARCQESDSEVVVLTDLFSRESYAKTLQLVEQTKKFFIAIHPYAEDLVIEPNGFMNYFIPVFTELFIENKPSGEYFGGKPVDHFEAFEIPTCHDHHRQVLNKLRINELSKRTIQQILSDMRKMLRSYRLDYDYILILYPMAYITGSEHLLLEYAQNCQGAYKPSADTIDLLQRLIGDDD